MIALLLASFVATCGALLAGRHLGRKVVWLGLVPMLATFAWLLSQAPDVLDGRPVVAAVAWVPELRLDLSFRLDGFSLIAALIVSGIGVLIFGYAGSYFAPHDGHPVRDDLWKLIAFLIAFAGSMLGLVLSDGFLTLFVCWELTSITSFLLIGIDDRRAEVRSSARQALLVTGGGGLALLAGLILLGQQSGASSFSELSATGVVDGGLGSVALVAVLVGIATKSAQVPFHFWLPGAMAAPTPISAYLHSATMVKAGVILCARLAPVVAGVEWWRPALVALGGTTMIVGGVGALRQFDAKLILAHGTVSQLGFLVVLVGLGTPGTTYAGVAVFVAHALFKAALFMGVGVIDHQCHTRDIRQLAGLHRSLPTVVWPMMVAAASMAGLPPLLGFVTKEKALDALLDADVGAWGWVAVGAVVVGSTLTVAYSARLMWGLMGSWAPDAVSDAPALASPPWIFVAPTILLSTLSVVGGLAAGPVGAFVADAASPLHPGAATKQLVLWPGLHLAFLLSAVAIVGGAGVARWLVLRTTDLGLARVPPPRSLGEQQFARGFDGLLAGARRITALTQSGSLPAYIAIVMSVLVAMLVTAIAVDGGDTVAPRGGGSIPLANSWIELGVSLVTAGFAISVPFARRRLEAAILLGATGFGVAVVFLTAGAPDLALTQILVETLSIVMFVLVLRHLPSRFSGAPAWAPTAVRVGLAGLVGTSIAVFAYLSSNSRTAVSVGDEMVRSSLPEGGGRNVVNVILVDIRGFDTLGEITVVAVAAVGVVNLVAAARREQQRKSFADGTDDLS